MTVRQSVENGSQKHHCPECGENKAVIINSRPTSEPGSVRRRRYHCANCGFRFSTREVVTGVDGAGMDDVRILLVNLRRDIELSFREHFGELYYGQAKTQTRAMEKVK